MKRLYQWCVLTSLLVAIPPTAAGQAPDPVETAAELDQRLASELSGYRWKEPVDAATFLRRVFLDIVGQTPTPDDILAYLADDDPQKRRRVVAHLLEDPQYGENWARYWRDVIMARKSEQRAVFAEPALEQFLSESFNQNRGWNQIAVDFITAKGDIRENGATAIMMAQAGRPEDTVAEISRIFCGIQIQCAQCHDHPTDQWTREQFHQLAAFFPRVAVRPNRQDGVRSFVVSVTDFEPRFARRRPNNNNRFRGTLEHRMPDLQKPNEPGEVMEPTFFVTQRKLPVGTPDTKRRVALAKWMTSPENPWFARAFVNRMWTELIGHGFYEPVDDIGPERDVAAPATLKFLCDAFVSSGHDIKWLLQTIMATRAYQQQSVALADCSDCTPAVLSPQRLRADQLLNAINVALDVSLDQAVIPRQGGPGPRRNSVRRSFRSVFGYDPSDPRAEIQGSIAQSLAMMNSRLTLQMLRATPSAPLGRLLAEQPNAAAAVEEVYLRTLSRFPSQSELKECLRYIREVETKREGIEDVQWALINSTEFLFRR